MKKFTINKIWSALFTLLFGIILFAHPTSTIDLVVTLAASIILIVGAFTELDVLHKGADIRPLNHLPGVALCVIALVIFTCKKAIISIVPLLFGIFILTSCISKLQDARHIKELGGNASIPYILAIIGIIFSLIIIINPFGSVVLFLRIIGFALIYSGFSDIILWIRIKQKY